MALLNPNLIFSIVSFKECPLTMLVVKTPQEVAILSEQTSAKSFKPFFLIPQDIPVALNPLGDTIPPSTIFILSTLNNYCNTLTYIY